MFFSHRIYNRQWSGRNEKKKKNGCEIVDNVTFSCQTLRSLLSDPIQIPYIILLSPPQQRHRSLKCHRQRGESPSGKPLCMSLEVIIQMWSALKWFWYTIKINKHKINEVGNFIFFGLIQQKNGQCSCHAFVLSTSCNLKLTFLGPYEIHFISILIFL